MNLKDLGNRLLWTAVSAAGGAVIAAPIFGIEAWQAAAVAASTAVVNLITLVARKRVAEYDATDPLD